MALSLPAYTAWLWLAGSVFASSVVDGRMSSSLSNAETSLTFIYQNNLNSSDDVNHIGAILLDPMTMSAGAAACNSLGESLLSKSALKAHESDFYHSLSYLEFARLEEPRQQYIIADGVVSVSPDWNGGGLDFRPVPYGNERLPVLCTQSSNQNGPDNAVATPSNEIRISSTGNTYVGFRNQKSFRFNGIPFANDPARFTYSTVYSPKGQTINATAYGPDCVQAYDSTSEENCLFMYAHAQSKRPVQTIC